MSPFPYIGLIWSLVVLTEHCGNYYVLLVPMQFTLMWCCFFIRHPLQKAWQLHQSIANPCMYFIVFSCKIQSKPTLWNTGLVWTLDDTTCIMNFGCLHTQSLYTPLTNLQALHNYQLQKFHDKTWCEKANVIELNCGVLIYLVAGCQCACARIGNQYTLELIFIWTILCVAR